ncbi:MAG: molybdenum ABC transporter ATP-binding protein [Gammaproteobacteria bacterium]|nr:molybdenum ABC transporter ATP-binding protein [Gammaproteobacteria bacterium]
MNIVARFGIRRKSFSLQAHFTVPASGVTGIFGASGSGKTTLLRAMAGLDRHSDGYLKVGQALWQDKALFVPAHQRDIGYVFQEPSLFTHLTVRENLDYARTRNPQRPSFDSLSPLIGLMGIAPLLTRHPATLSGGEQQRVAICRALATGPGMLLMDEPLASLDYDRQQDILPYLEALHAQLDIPILYVSHVVDEIARLCDHLIVLDNGQVSASGPVQELFTRLDLPLSQGALAETVIEAVVDSHDQQYALTHVEFSGGMLTVTRCQVDVGQAVRVRIAAKDVSLTLEHQTNTSILNIFPATVVQVVPTTEPLLTVQLTAGDELLLAHVTRKSADALGLRPGRSVYVQAKSVALLA